MARLLVDATSVTNTFCGYNTHAEKLLEALVPLLPEHEITVLMQAELTAEHPFRQLLDRLPAASGRAVTIPVLGPGRDLWGWRRRRLAQELGVDLYHCLHSNPLCLAGVWSMATLHDLTALVLPEYFWRWRRLKQLYLRHNYRRLLQRCDKVICVSRNTADDAGRLLALPASRLEVIHEAGSMPPAPASAPPGVEGPPFFLAVGGRPHKNPARLLHAFARFRQQCDAPVRLLIAGKMHSTLDPVVAALDADARGAVEFLGQIGDEELAGYYASCLALVFASLYEGFGLPALEAMQAGAPVIAANTSSLPEIVGDAAILVDPRCETEIAEAMEKVFRAPPEERSRLSQAGREQAAKFSWSRAAQETVAVYRQCPAFEPPS